MCAEGSNKADRCYKCEKKSISDVCVFLMSPFTDLVVLTYVRALWRKKKSKGRPSPVGLALPKKKKGVAAANTAHKHRPSFARQAPPGSQASFTAFMKDFS